MYKLAISAMLLTILLIRVTAVAQDDFEYESWPYEGVPYFKVVNDKLVLYKSASSKSPIVVTINVEKGSIMSFDFGVKELIKKREAGIDKDRAKINKDLILGKSIQKTLKPGIIRATTSGAIMFSLYEKGAVIEHLMDLGEGQCLYRYDGKVFENECLFNNPYEDGMVQESQPVTEWWVTAVKNGKTIGWLKIDDKSPLHMIETIK